MDENNKSDTKNTTATNVTEEIKNEPANFEQAIETAGFGTFNLILLILSVPANCATIFETTTMSYILPVAECDLKLTLFDKGILNAVTYAGMISSAIIWGYLADTQGRKKILILGYLLGAVCVFCSSLSQNFEMIVVFKFLGGFVVGGPNAVLFTYLSEVHSAKHRPLVVMIMGMLVTMATFLMPILAFAIFPRSWEFTLFEVFRVHTWQIFLAVCGIPSLLAGFIMLCLPESPKFLMSQGRNAEALRAFQKIYAFNSRKPEAAYPITLLVEEAPSRYSNENESIYNIENKTNKQKLKPPKRSFLEALHEGMQQIKPMFRKPLLGHSLHAYFLQFFIFVGMNTIRLWLPQLFASISEYEALNTTDKGSSNLCTILEYSVNKTSAQTIDFEDLCSERKVISLDTYMNNIIVGLVGVAGYFATGFIVKTLGPKRILILGLLISGILGFSLYWSTSGVTTLIISSLFVTIGCISISSLMGVVVELFPTSLRTLTVALIMMFGRLGALSGNMLFPVLLEMGCIPPFAMVSAVMLCASLLSCILPSGKKTAFI